MFLTLKSVCKTHNCTKWIIQQNTWFARYNSHQNPSLRVKIKPKSLGMTGFSWNEHILVFWQIFKSTFPHCTGEKPQIRTKSCIVRFDVLGKLKVDLRSSYPRAAHIHKLSCRKSFHLNKRRGRERERAKEREPYDVVQQTWARKRNNCIYNSTIHLPRESVWSLECDFTKSFPLVWIINVLFRKLLIITVGARLGFFFQKPVWDSSRR